MSGKIRRELVVWGMVVSLVSLFAVEIVLGARIYSGTEVSFSANVERFFNIEADSPVRLQAADGDYFRLIQREKQLYGIPYAPPMGNPDDGYFFIESERVEGEWRVVEGNFYLLLTSDDSFTVTKYPTDSTKTYAIILGIGFGAIVFIAGVAIRREMIKKSRK